MTVKEVQELVEVWNAKHGVRQSELSRMALLAEKVGELARAVALKQSEPRKNSNGGTDPLAEELADILWETLSFAANAEIDLGDALIDLLDKKNRTK